VDNSAKTWLEKILQNSVLGKEWAKKMNEKAVFKGKYRKIVLYNLLVKSVS